MGRTLALCSIALVLGSGLAFAEEHLILKIARPVASNVLADAGLDYLVGLDDSYLVWGDQPALRRLSRAGVSFAVVSSVLPGEEIFLLRPRSYRDEVKFSEFLIAVDDGHYIATPETHEIEDLRLLPFSKVRLFPTSFPERSMPQLVHASQAISPRPEVVNMIADVSGDTLWQYISQLSGREPVVIGGALDTLVTRYSYSWRIDHAAQYLLERFQDYGLDAAFHEYVVGKYSFYSTDWVDASNGWVVGNDQRIFRTRDGGLTWVRQKPGATFQSFWGVCFVDTSSGWIAGTGGRIYHSPDGGETWIQQTTPISVTLREITFLDSLTGWTVGYSGQILRTTDGGVTWVSVPSGTSSDLYGLHFDSPSRGWACGIDGEILFWDGAAWSAQSSGTAEYLLDIHFADADTGYVVGGGGTVLKTVDGGQTWTGQTAPAGADPYLKGVCFVDASNGWAVGLSGTLIHTSDGGANWEIQPTGTLFGLRWVRFLDGVQGWAAGYGCTILHTTDGGTTWESQRENLPSGALLALKNVVATKPGTSSDQEVVICGHYDSTSEDPQNLAPGADDNASGTAAVIEAARIMADYPFDKTIKFLCFSGEEQGLYGSGEYAGGAKMAGDDIIGVLNFDMIGYVNAVPEDVDLVGDWASEWLVDFTLDCASAYVPALPTLKIIDESMVYSDHASFWQAGYSAILGIEDKGVPYPYYHTTGDTLGHLTQAFTTDVVKMAVAAAAELAAPDTTAGIDGPVEGGVVAYAYPNPFHASATISFALPSSGPAEVKVFNVEGKVVRTLHSGSLPAGRYTVSWQGDDGEGRQVAAGIYFVRMEADRFDASTKILRLR